MHEFKLFPETDARQAHRMRRYLMAASTSFMVLLLLCLLAWQGFLEWSVLSNAGIAITLLVVAFYVAFRTGLNERLSDPSLTVPMILAATSVLAYVVYNADQARGVFMLLYLLPFLFGVFRLSTGTLLNLTLFTIVLYFLVMLGIWHYRGDAFDFRLEVVQWLVLCVVLTWFSFMGGYISKLRRNLAASNVRLETAFRTIQEMSVRDELTGTYNRRYLMQLLVQEKNRIDRGGRGMAVCILDLDHFKSINDSYGHLAGDAVLRVITAEAQASLRTSDFFGRYGGEEFLMILTQTPLEGARVIADRFRRRMEALGFPEIDPQLGITTSIGIAEYIGGEDVVQTLARADAALYRAKHLGRNRVELAENRPAYESAAQN
jgi:diguanylate cyclase (GGDEF)-like protein